MSWRNRYPGCLLVICEGRMVFPVDPVTLEPLACTCYDHWCLSEPDQQPRMGYAEWSEKHMRRLQS